MADIIKIRHGNKSQLPILQNSEPGYCVDTNELFIGTENGNKRPGQEDIDLINNDIENIGNQIDKITNKVTWISIKDFDAKGDGVTDDTQAILNAYNSLEEGQTLYFPLGVYKVNSAEDVLTVLKNNITFKGMGSKQSIIDAVNSDGFGFLLQGSGITVEDIGFKKKIPSDIISSTGIQPSLYLHNGNGTCKNNIIKRVYVEGGADCLRIDGGYPENCTIEDSEFRSSTTGTKGCTIHGRNGKGFKFINNRCYGGRGASGINLYKVSDSIIQGNHVYDNGFAGCEIEDSLGNNIVIGNIFIDCRHGVMIDDSFNNQVEGNNIITTKKWNLEDTGIYIGSKSLDDGSVWCENNTVKGNTIVGYATGISLLCLDSQQLHANAKIKQIFIDNNVIIGCSSGIAVGSSESVTKISDIYIADNKIIYDNRLYTSSSNGVYIAPKVDHIYIEENTIKTFNKNIYIYNNPSDNIYILNNKCFGGILGDIEISQSNALMNVFNNKTDKAIIFNETSVFTGSNIKGLGNYSKTGGMLPNNQDTLFAYTPRKRQFKNNSGATITKGQIVKLDTSYSWATNITKPTTKNDKLVIGVASEDIENGAYGNIIVDGLCDVFYDTSSNAIAKNDILTNNNTNAVLAISSDRSIFVAMESLALGQPLTLKKAILINR